MCIVHFPNLSPVEEFPRSHFSQAARPAVHTCTPQPCPHQRTPQSDLQEAKKVPLSANPKSGVFLPGLLVVSLLKETESEGIARLVAVSRTATMTLGKCRRGIGGLRPGNSKVTGASGTTHQGIRCHPGLGLLEGQSQRSLVCDQLPTGVAEPGKA